MASAFLRYYIRTDKVTGLADCGPYDGRRLYGIGSSRCRRGFPTVEIVWRSGRKCTQKEAAGFMNVVATSAWSTGFITGASLLPDGDATRTALSDIDTFCHAIEVPVPASVFEVEAFTLMQGWFYHRQYSLAAVIQTQEATIGAAAKTD